MNSQAILSRKLNVGEKRSIITQRILMFPTYTTSLYYRKVAETRSPDRDSILNISILCGLRWFSGRVLAIALKQIPSLKLLLF